MYDNVLQVRDLYLEQKTITEICNLTNICSPTIRKYLKKLNIYDPKRDKRQSDISLIDYVKSLYLEGKEVDEISVLVDRGEATIRRWLNKEHVLVHRRNGRINLDFFHEINTEEKAYWLGFIYADGCIFSNETGVRRFSICLSVRDREHLQKLGNIFNQQIEQFPGSSHLVSLVIGGPNIYNDLSDHGIEECKTNSNKTTVLEYVSCGLINHFIRGYFDGDGSVSHLKNDKRRCTFNLVGSHNFIPKVQEIMENNIPGLSEILITEVNNVVCSLYYRKHDNFKEIYKWLYKDATVWLERKREKFEEILIELHGV